MSFRRFAPLLAVSLTGCGLMDGDASSANKALLSPSTEESSPDGGRSAGDPPALKSDSNPTSGSSSDRRNTSDAATQTPDGGKNGQAGPSDQGGRGRFSELKAAALTFSLPSRPFETPARDLWATYYYTPRFSHLDNGFELRDLNEAPLGPKLSHRQWCDSAMEGSVQVLMNGEWRTYNYAGTSTTVQVDCSRYFKHPVGRTRFKLARGPYGDGVRNFILSPYRTIAVDPDVIPYGTVIYIDAARGLPFRMPDGSQRLHDGYFFAGDTGGLIRGQHIDVYIGIDTLSPFSWITSQSSSRIQYQIVPDTDLKEVLLELHLQN